MSTSYSNKMVKSVTLATRLKVRGARFIAISVFLTMLAAIFISASSGSSFYGSRKALPTSPTSGRTDTNKNKNKTEARKSSVWQAESKSAAASMLAALMPTAGADEVATYAADCTTPKSSFVLGDTVCAIVSGNPDLTNFPRRLSLVDSAGFVRDVTPVATDPQSISFTLPTSATSIVGVETVDNRGGWRINSLPGGSNRVRTNAFFTVSDPQNVIANLVVYKSGAGDSEVVAGSNLSFGLWLTNRGPDTATNVTLTDAVPANTTFVNGQQDDGPTFSCTFDSVTANCTIASLAPGATARFTLIYAVDGGTSQGTVIANTATIGGATAEANSLDNSETATAVVIAGTPTTCTLDCQNNIITTADTTQAGIEGKFVTFAAPEAFGTCGAVTSNPASGSFFPVGTTQVNSSSATGGGSCSFTIRVISGTPPSITCPANQSVQTAAGETEASVSVGTPTATPANATVNGVRNDNRPVTDPYPIGTTTITWTAIDADDRTASCTQTITVTEATPLVITCPNDVTATAPTGSCEASVNPGTATATPAGATIEGVRSDSQALSDPYPAGQTKITWTATAPDGRISSCVQTITVNANDTTPPVLTIPADLNVATSTCSALLDDELGVATATDNCSSSVNIVRSGVPTISCPPTPANPSGICESFVFPTGTTNVTYTATDAAGNVTVGVQHVTVYESTPPTFTSVPSDVGPVYTGAGATSCNTVVSDATLGAATASDNCAGVSVTRSGVPSQNRFPVGTTDVTYTATDASGNTAVAHQHVTVVDNTPPVITSVPAGGQTDAGSCTALIPDVVTGTQASDNCAILSVTQSPAAGTAVGLGTYTITVTATDVNGNSSQAQTTFTVNALQFTGNVWLGLKNSDDVGTKFDLLAEVLKNGTVVGSNQINDLSGGSSGFNNAILRTVSGTISSVGFCTGDTLGLRLSVRIAASSSHVSGTARLWYNSAAANSRFGRVVNGVTTTYYLRNISSALVLDPATGTTQSTIDVLVNRNQNGNAFKPFGTWNITY